MLKDLFDYTDYRQFMADLYAYRKSQNPHFSYRYMGAKMDLDSGFLAKVIQGKMHLTLKSIEGIVKFCKFQAKEREYFETMIKYGRAKGDQDALLYLEKLVSLKGIHTEIIEEKKYRFYTKWYYSAIRALLGYYPFTGDFTAIANQLNPKISTDEAQEAIELLLDLGFLRQNEEDQFYLTDRMITTGDSWRSEAIHSFQKETLKLALAGIDRHSKEMRDFSTITVAVSHEDLAEIRLRAKDFRQSILQMKTGRDQQDVVYQINIQVLPLTEIKSS